MVQDIKMVRYRHGSRHELAERPDDAGCSKIALGIVVFTDDEDTWMMPLSHGQQVVEIFKIVVIVRNKDSIFADSLGEMHGVIFTGHADLGTARF